MQPAAAIHWFEELDSTNAEARRMADAGEDGPLWIAARRQTAGRGRRGRAWETGQGNLAATLLLTLDRTPAEAAQLSFVAALAVGDLARRFAPAASVGNKWPNDVLLEGRKLAGVLIESGRREDGRLWLAIGVGVNLASAPEGTEFPAISLASVQAPPTPEEALGVLAEAMADRIALWTASGFPAVRQAWLEHAHGLGASCTARLPAESVEGVAEGLDTDGALLLRLADRRVRRITAGDIFFGPSASSG
ncbi:MAG: biotin--[acetyl-CoA-carboxylase] ligase [Caulobacteraceae bacterium]